MIAFDKHGWLIGEIPEECVSACSHSGRCDEDVEYWVNRLEFTQAIESHLDLARRYLKEFGAWDDLETAPTETLAQCILWTACCDISEQGEWYGLIH